MGDFNRSKQFGRRDRRSEGRPERSFGRRDRDSGSFDRPSFGRTERRKPLEMHDVICDKCGKECQVPFRPTEGKPVYCSDCFRKNEGSSEPGLRNDNSKELEQINRKLDKIIRALEIE